MDDRDKIVDFGKYCKECKHWELPESEEPCESCLTEPTNVNTHRSIMFERKDNEK
jgi:hypothetical protein